VSEGGNEFEAQDPHAPAFAPVAESPLSDESPPIDEPSPSDEPSLGDASPPRDEPSLSDGSPADETPESDDDLRARLVGQFEQWLDAMLADESAPPVAEEWIAEALAETSDADPESAGTDLYSLFAALTGLTGEIRLQGRAFKQLTDSIAPLGDLPASLDSLEAAQHAAGDQLEQLAEQLKPASSGTALPPSKEVLGVLFDLLERLERGLATFEAGIAAIKANPPRGLFARMSGATRRYNQMLATIEAVHEGQRLTFSRLEAANQQWGIQRVGRKGDMFDPATMTAFEVDTGSSLPDGTIVEVLRSGYMFHGQLLAGSQVKVAKRK
jgi:molecular chaperone GrpE